MRYAGILRRQIHIPACLLKTRIISWLLPVSSRRAGWFPYWSLRRSGSYVFWNVDISGISLSLWSDSGRTPRSGWFWTRRYKPIHCTWQRHRSVRGSYRIPPRYKRQASGTAERKSSGNTSRSWAGCHTGSQLKRFWNPLWFPLYRRYGHSGPSRMQSPRVHLWRWRYRHLADRCRMPNEPRNSGNRDGRRSRKNPQKNFWWSDNWSGSEVLLFDQLQQKRRGSGWKPVIFEFEAVRKKNATETGLYHGSACSSKR